MNYLRHLNRFFERLAGDKRLSSYHISLYLALFRQWNACRFCDRFVVSRSEMMELARIGSANTYARCMKELTEWGYIHYKASSNLHCGSTVSCIRFDTDADPASGTESDTGTKSDTTDSHFENQFPDPDNSSGIKTNTAADTGSDTTGDTDISGNLKSDTAGNTAGDTSIKYDAATDTGDDTASSTGTASGRRTDTATGAGSHENNPSGIKSDTGTDTASDTLLINITNKNKQEENQKKKENPKEKEKTKKREREENPKMRLEEKPEEKTEIPNFSEVVSFFEENHFSQNEAQKFYARYQSAGWKTGDNQKIISWQALARKWMTNNKKNNSHERPFNQVGAGRLSVPTGKDYSEPL